MIDPGRWTRAQVEERVTKWNRDLQVATQNILELMEDFSYKNLTGDGGLGTIAIEGETKRKVAPVLAALDEVWQTLPLLTKVIDEVNVRFRELPWFKDAQPLWQIQQLLEGESVQFVTKTTYAQRGLLTPDEVVESRRPDSVLAAMIQAYADAKAVVVEVEDAVRKLSAELDESARDLAELTAVMPGSPDVAKLAPRLLEIRNKLASDPLGMATAFEREIAPVLTRLRKSVDDAKAERARAEIDVAAADLRMATLEAAYAEATAAHDERQAKVKLDRDPQAPFERAVVDELAAWLVRLRATVAAGKWRAASIGIANWNAQLDARLADCNAVAAANRAPLDRRHELRGLIDAFKAKAVAIGLAEDPKAAELYRRAHALLHTRPTPLDAAEQVVTEYLAVVR